MVINDDYSICKFTTSVYGATSWLQIQYHLKCMKRVLKCYQHINRLLITGQKERAVGGGISFPSKSHPQLVSGKMLKRCGYTVFISLMTDCESFRMCLLTNVAASLQPPASSSPSRKFTILIRRSFPLSGRKSPGSEDNISRALFLGCVLQNIEH